ncbi:MFS transporter [Murinocardiopsis flavida]|uniref:MFS transporter n=1 Tax=Murinocardiopsis flavida TaxID=645275 RepID=A0A2P8CLZ8_9ACTN|nr:MFS transporter [Murinocardiopsis flavida]PSK85985.1 MFS transporter [Murinocardiopsis flavida]
MSVEQQALDDLRPDPASAADPGPPPARSAVRGAVGILAVAGLAASLVQTLVVPLLPTFPAALGTTPSGASWLVTVTILTGAVSTAVLSRLGDIFGKKRLLLIALAFLVAGSVVCAVASSLPLMLLGRALQGISLVAIPLGISIIPAVSPPERIGTGMALISASLGIGGAVGLPLAGALTEAFDFHVLFWMCAIGGVLALGAVAVAVPEVRPAHRARVDLVGAVMLTAVLSTLLLPVSNGSVWGWTSPWTIGLLAAFAVLLPLFAWHQARRADPLVDVRTLRRPPVAITNVATMFIGFAMFANFMAGPAILQQDTATGYGFGTSLTVAGLCMLPIGMMMVVLAPVSARVSARWGARTSVLLGCAAMVAGYVMWLLFNDSLALVVLNVVVVGMGVAFCFAALPTIVTASAPAAEGAAANGINNVARNIGSALSSAVGGALLAAMTPAGTGGAPLFAAYLDLFVAAGCAAAVALVLMLFVPAHLGRVGAVSGAPRRARRRARSS